MSCLLACSTAPNTRIQNEFMFDVKQIGMGAFGQAYKGKMDCTLSDNCSYGKQVACKVITARSSRAVEKINSEYQTLVKVQNIHYFVNVFGIEWLDREAAIFMEFCRYGSLQEWVGKRGALTPHQSFISMVDLIDGLNWLHRRIKIFHRDLKPDNIFISRKRSNGTLKMKIADFGLAKFYEDDREYLSAHGMFGYRAPEAIHNYEHSYGREADFYALGGILHFMKYGVHPSQTMRYDANDFPIFPRSQQSESWTLKDYMMQKVADDRFAGNYEFVDRKELRIGCRLYNGYKEFTELDHN